MEKPLKSNNIIVSIIVIFSVLSLLVIFSQIFWWVPLWFGMGQEKAQQKNAEASMGELRGVIAVEKVCEDKQNEQFCSDLKNPFVQIQILPIREDGVPSEIQLLKSDHLIHDAFTYQQKLSPGVYTLQIRRHGWWSNDDLKIPSKAIRGFNLDPNHLIYFIVPNQLVVTKKNC